jgi:hypothetical protein
MSTEIDKLPFNTSTDLPVRDIPRETISHVADPQINTHYVPPPVPRYIDEDKPKQNYEEYKLPLILSILYFLWNIPSVQTYIEKLAPIFIDSNFGLVAKSISFGAFYYVFTLGVVYFIK